MSTDNLLEQLRGEIERTTKNYEDRISALKKEIGRLDLLCQESPRSRSSESLYLRKMATLIEKTAPIGGSGFAGHVANAIRQIDITLDSLRPKE